MLLYLVVLGLGWNLGLYACWVLSPIPGQSQLGGIWIPEAQDLYFEPSVLKLILSEGRNPQEFFQTDRTPAWATQLTNQGIQAQFTFTDYVRASSSLEYVRDLGLL